MRAWRFSWPIGARVLCNFRQTGAHEIDGDLMSQTLALKVSRTIIEKAGRYFLPSGQRWFSPVTSR
jgi:hypothetical protein